MTTSLVIGGNGFLGSHIVDLLVELGHTVTVFDRFSSTKLAYSSLGVREVRGDFLDEHALSIALQGQDNVFHFLSMTTPATAHANPLLDVQANLTGSVRLMETAANLDVKQLFFASTGGAIYSPGAQASFRESHPTHPVSPYGIVKLAIEHYLGFYRETRGLDYKILRISNPYGPRQRPDRPQGLIATALSHVARDLPVTRFGDGSMIRDYLYVDDMTRMIERVIVDQGHHSTYNIGSGSGHTVNQIFQSVQRVTGVELRIHEAEKPGSFTERSILDTTRFAKDFGQPNLTLLDDGIRKTWEYLQGHEAAVFKQLRPRPTLV